MIGSSSSYIWCDGGMVVGDSSSNIKPVNAIGESCADASASPVRKGIGGFNGFFPEKRRSEEEDVIAASY